MVIGDVSERPKVQLSKSCVGESPPWVQIPPSPLFGQTLSKGLSAVAANKVVAFDNEEMGVI